MQMVHKGIHMEETEKNKPRRLFIGSVVSDSMQKTVVVRVERSYTHARLHKVLRSARKFTVHDENEQASVGDIVEFYEGRPVSKTKCMYLHKVVGRKS